MIARLAYIGGIFLIGLFTTPLILIPAAFIYAMRWFAPELILLGFLFDAYFGAASRWPLYTIGGFSVVIVALIARRYLMFKTPPSKIG